MEFLTDPTLYSVLKVVGDAVLFMVVVVFLIGAVVGWVIRGVMR